MSTPMYDMPEHMKFPLTEEGAGPAEGDDFHHWGCWCGDSTCTKWQDGTPKPLPGVEEESCGQPQPMVEDGQTCIKFKGHEDYTGQERHITESGVWW